MWKKEEEMPTTPDSSNEGEGRGASSRSDSTASEPATIGPSITIRGEVSGDEDLLIQGRVDGQVDLAKQSVTVGRDGQVEADITARVVAVEGRVVGDLQGDEQVILRSSARVDGDITSPRVVLEDGASFRGLVDMGEAGAGKDDGSAARGSKKHRGSTGVATDDDGSTPSPSSGGEEKRIGSSDATKNDEEADDAERTSGKKTSGKSGSATATA